MRQLLFYLTLVLLAGCAASDAVEPAQDWGPFYAEYHDVDGMRRQRMLGPLLERSGHTNLTFHAVRPLYSRTVAPQLDKVSHEILWPVSSIRTLENQLSFWFLLAYGHVFDLSEDEGRYRFWLLPFYFQGRDAAGEFYMALFPLYGSIHEFLGRDEIDFALWPLWSTSSINDVHTWNVLWPFISRTEGKGIYRFRVAPFYGQSKHRERFRKRFVMWPFWSWAEWNYPHSKGTGYIVFPLWGHIDLTDQQSWLVFPPLFRFHRGQRQNSMYAPWPFIQTAQGETEKFYIWPLYGTKDTRSVQSKFVLWPLYQVDKVDRGDSIGKRKYILPFWFYEKRDTRPDAYGMSERIYEHKKVWPVATYIRDRERKRVRLPALWPLQSTGGIERNWEPLWSLYAYDAAGVNEDYEFLWGLYRHQRRDGLYYRTSIFPVAEWSHDRGGETGRSWSILKGLLGYKRVGDQRQWQLLYLLKFGTMEKTP